MPDIDPALMTHRYAAAELRRFTATLFERAGVEPVAAEALACGFLEADLLGFSTHGLARVPANLAWLRDGVTTAHGSPTVLSERPAVANWDGNRLPGPLLMRTAVDHAMDRARDAGAFTLVIRRAQHVACLAAALVPVVEQKLVALVMASSPDEAYVSPFGGSARLFSNNPLAFAAPTRSEPILFDVSMAITAGGQVLRAAREGRRLGEPALKTGSGQVTDDPQALIDSGTVMPIGGSSHGHKGHALTIMTEVMTQALAGFGRRRSVAASELNNVYLQVLDPEAFGPLAGFLDETDHLLARVAATAADEPDAPVRIPGSASWRRRARQPRLGVALHPHIVEDLTAAAGEAGIALPEPVRAAVVTPGDD